MKIAIGSDHAGYVMKQRLQGWLSERGHQVIDCGTDSEQPADYPAFCAAVARKVVKGEADRGIVLGGSGQGEAMSANKVRGARAALCNDLFTARLGRQHNDANVLSMGARIVAFELACEIVETFLEVPFDAGRHVARLEQITDIEREECQ